MPPPPVPEGTAATDFAYPASPRGRNGSVHVRKPTGYRVEGSAVRLSGSAEVRIAFNSCVTELWLTNVSILGLQLSESNLLLWRIKIGVCGKVELKCKAAPFGTFVYVIMEVKMSETYPSPIY
jgi:hypothetical protein